MSDWLCFPVMPITCCTTGCSCLKFAFQSETRPLAHKCQPDTQQIIFTGVCPMLASNLIRVKKNKLSEIDDESESIGIGSLCKMTKVTASAVIGNGSGHELLSSRWRYARLIRPPTGFTVGAWNGHLCQTNTIGQTVQITSQTVISLHYPYRTGEHHHKSFVCQREFSSPKKLNFGLCPIQKTILFAPFLSHKQFVFSTKKKKFA